MHFHREFSASVAAGDNANLRAFHASILQRPGVAQSAWVVRFSGSVLKSGRSTGCSRVPARHLEPSMRVAILSILVLATTAAAQQPPINLNPQGQAKPGVTAQPVAQPVAQSAAPDPRLDKWLDQWEQKMRSVT